MGPYKLQEAAKSPICVNRHVWTAASAQQKEKMLLMGEFTSKSPINYDAWLWNLAPHLRHFENSKGAFTQSSCRSKTFGEPIGSVHESKECVPSMEAFSAISLADVWPSKLKIPWDCAHHHSVKTRHNSCLNDSESDVILHSQKTKRRVKDKPTGNLFNLKKISKTPGASSFKESRFKNILYR